MIHRCLTVFVIAAMVAYSSYVNAYDVGVKAPQILKWLTNTEWSSDRLNGGKIIPGTTGTFHFLFHPDWVAAVSAGRKPPVVAHPFTHSEGKWTKTGEWKLEARPEGIFLKINYTMLYMDKKKKSIDERHEFLIVQEPTVKDVVLKLVAQSDPVSKIWLTRKQTF